MNIILKILFFGSCLACFTQANPVDFDLFHERTLLPTEKFAEGYRLPLNTRPTQYEVRLSTKIHLPEDDPEKFKFSGTVTIYLNALEDTQNITLHARQLTDLEGTLWKETEEVEEGEEKYTPIKLKDNGVPTTDEDKDFIIFHVLDEDLVPEVNYKLVINYKGTLRTDNQGFYRSFYITEEGEKRWLATTQFESTDSRHGFPCFDEPSIRARFQINIEHDKSYRAISNMPVKEVQPINDNRVLTVFENSIRTHASILAFVISDFKYIGKQVENETPQRVFARPAAIDSGLSDFALDAGVALLRYLENYFEVPYEVGKMDQISIPDFAAGAMENWGLVTYREELFLYDPKTSAMSLRDKVATIVAHEYAHMYFGNLVSIEWWDYAWLKEGFATYFEYMSSAAVYPELRDDDYFVIKAQHNAFVTDALESSRPMTFHVEDPVSIAANFDFVIYSKAGSVIRMWQHALSEPVFRKGLQNYLNTMKYQAATPKDLALGLQVAVNETSRIIDVEELINSWSLKAGFPVVHVSRLEDNKLSFKQEKFSYSKPKEDDTDNFMIPISFTTSNKQNFHDTLPKVWLNGESVEVSPSSDVTWTKDDWIIVNIQESGYYRVNYDNGLWELIRKKLWSDKFEEIHHLNRAQLVDDALNLARGGYVNYATAFSIVQFLAKEKDFAPWTAASKSFDYLNRLLIDSKNYKNFKRFVNELVTPLYKDLTINDGGASEGVDIKDSRNIAIRWACLTDDKSCVQQTASKVNDIINNPELEVEANSRQAIYCNGLREANETLFDGMIAKLQNTVDLADRTILFSAIGCTQNAELQKKYLESSVATTGNNYRPQERNRILDAVIGNGGKNGLETSIEFLNKNWEKVENLYNPPVPVKRAVNRIAEMVTSEELNEKYKILLETLNKAGELDEQEIGAISTTVKANIDWVDAYDKDIKDYFDRLYSGSAQISASFTVLITAFVTILTIFR